MTAALIVLSLMGAVLLIHGSVNLYDRKTAKQKKRLAKLTEQYNNTPPQQFTMNER